MLSIRVNLSTLLLYLLFNAYFSHAVNGCTIVSAKAANGHVWTANNEDGPFDVANFINFYPKTSDQPFGYYTLSYASPQFGNGSALQGGMNEAGLTFDFNAIPTISDFDFNSRKKFPQGNEAILPHILSTMKTVDEVVTFFEIFWFGKGFINAQMHVADRFGKFAIISASGIRIAHKKSFLVSTNFDLSDPTTNSDCWRYSTAISKLENARIDYPKMKEICIATAQKNGATMYSNIQNLNTGDIWFFSKHDPDKTVKINLHTMLTKGKRSYSFSDLNALLDASHSTKKDTIQFVSLSEEKLTLFAGSYHNDFTGNIDISVKEDALVLSFSDGWSGIFKASTLNTFYSPETDIKIAFIQEPNSDKISCKFYEGNFWSFTAHKTERK